MVLEGLPTYFDSMTLTTSTSCPAKESIQINNMSITNNGHAIAELENALYIVETNLPINEKEGNLEQANLERECADSFRAAIKQLKEE